MNLTTLFLIYLKMISQFLNEFITIDIILISFIFILLVILAIVIFIQLLWDSAWWIWKNSNKIGNFLRRIKNTINNWIISSITQSKYTDKAKGKAKYKKGSPFKVTKQKNKKNKSKSFVLPFIDNDNDNWCESFLDIVISNFYTRIIQLANRVLLLSIVALNCFFKQQQQTTTTTSFSVGIASYILFFFFIKKKD